MRVVHVSGGEYKDTLGTYSRYEDFGDDSVEEVFFYGHRSTKREDVKSRYSNYKRKAYLNLEHPCSFFVGGDAIKSLEFFDEVYTICPYTARWLNGKGKTIYIPIIEPYRGEYFEKYNKFPEKKKDVIYHGGVHSSPISYMIDTIKKFDYSFVSLLRDTRATHRNIKSKKKWDLISEAKCSVAMNLLFPTHAHVSNVKMYIGWENNVAFKDLNDNNVPQMKARIIEAAACQTLNVVYKDQWNVIENWFDKDEFIYWETFAELHYLLEDISDNFDKYIPTIEKAHNRAKQYTVQKFFENVSKNI